MKSIAWVAAACTAIGSAVYMVVSLARWEWNRALFFGVILLITEVAMATALVLHKLTAVLAARDERDPEITAILRANRPERPNRFAWLDDAVRRNQVFIMFLVGGGVVLSGAAWVVDRIAGATTTPARERKLAGELGDIAYPRGGLVLDDTTVLAQEVPGADDVQIRHLLRRAGDGT